MMLQVFVPIPKPLGTWGGSCGRYYRLEVYCYDTNCIRPQGSQTTDPYSPHTYKYCPAVGAEVHAKFYNDNWSETVSCQIPTNQPESYAIPWCELAVYIPCSACGDKQDTYINIDLEVRYHGFVWKNRYPKAIHVFCPKPNQPSPYLIRVFSTGCEVSNGKIQAKFSSDNTTNILIGLYASRDGVSFKLITYKSVILTTKPKEIQFTIPKEYEYLGIAPVKAGTSVVSKNWVCSRYWSIRL